MLPALTACACFGAPQGITATASQRVHPVLIRNHHNELVELVVDLKGPGPATLESVTCNLDGTDNLEDIETLEMFSTADKREFAPGTAFGAPVRPAAEVSFRGGYPLRAGTNVFWVSARLRPAADLSRHIAAACTAIVTSAGSLTPAGASPALRRRIGIALRKHGDDGVHTYRIPALATSPKGTLLTVYDMRRRMSRDLQEDIDIGLSRSTDGGRTWEEPRVIMDMGEYGGLPQEQNGCSDPGIIVDQKTGEIFVFAVWMWGKPGKHQWRDDGSEPGFEIGKSAHSS
jgi:sialidase-1